jgi:hypothetical protein
MVAPRNAALAVNACHPSVVIHPVTQLESRAYWGGAKTAVQWICPALVGELKQLAAHRSIESMGGTNRDASSASERHVAIVPVRARIYPYSSATGPPAMKPPAKTPPMASHVAMSVTQTASTFRVEKRF